MRILNNARVSAPSASLLRFLRAQTEQNCFFTPTAISPTSQGSQASKPYSQHALIRKPPSRGLSTTLRRKATVESSILNFEPFRTNPRQDLLYYPTTRGNARPRTTNVCTDHQMRDTRDASSNSRPFLQRWWHPKSKRLQAALESDDLPALPGLLDDSRGSITGRSVGKAPNELKLRCTEFDENGKVTLMSGEFKKSELIAKVQMVITYLVSNSH